MEIQAVVEHEPPDKGVKWKAQSAEEVGKKTTLSWGLGVGMSCPSSGSRISGRGHRTSAAGCRADHPYARTP